MAFDSAVPSFRKATNNWLTRLESSGEFAHRPTPRATVGVRSGREKPVAVWDTRRGRPQNHLLRALPRDVLDSMLPFLQRVRIEQRDLLLSPGEPIEFVYFPETMVASLVSILSRGEVTEVGTVGCEGLIGLPVFLGESSSAQQAFVQVAGYAECMTASSFARVVRSSPDVQRVMLRYTQAFLAQVMHTAACNASHLAEERCARWILTTNDRVLGDEIEVTHDFLAFTLGVRRAGVTAIMNSLRHAGLITYTHGRVRVRDLAGLEAVACECYALIRSVHTCRHHVDAT